MGSSCATPAPCPHVIRIIESKKTISPKLWEAIIGPIALRYKVEIRFSQFWRYRLFALQSFSFSICVWISIYEMIKMRLFRFPSLISMTCPRKRICFHFVVVHPRTATNQLVRIVDGLILCRRIEYNAIQILKTCLTFFYVRLSGYYLFHFKRDNHEGKMLKWSTIYMWYHCNE